MSRHIPLTADDRAQLAALLLRLAVEIGGAGGNLTIMIEPARQPRWTLERIDMDCNVWTFESDSLEAAYQEALEHPTTAAPEWKVKKNAS
jgi:hypothetical protein